MRIAILGAFWRASLEESYARAFESLGHEVIRLNFDDAYRSHVLASRRLTEVLARPIVARHAGLVIESQLQPCDLLFVVKGKRLMPESLRRFRRRLGETPIVNFNPDSPWDELNSSRWLIESIPEYDLHLTWSTTLDEAFRKAGAKDVKPLRFAYDPLLHYPLSEPTGATGKVAPALDLVFVGTYSRERDELLSRLGKLNIAIWGNDWHNARHVSASLVKGNAAYGEDALRIMQRSLCALNILRPQNRHAHNMRSYEIPATGNLMLASRSEDHMQMLEEGHEAFFFDNPEDIVRMVISLRDDPERIRTVATQGRLRIEGETYRKRAHEILIAAGLSQ